VIPTLLLFVVCLSGIVLTSFQALLVWRFSRLGRLPYPPPPADDRPSCAEPRVSVLKPLCGLEDDLEQNLASFAALTGVSYEVIFSVASAHDPVIEVVEKVRRRFPEAPFKLVVGGIAPGLVANPKVERLIAAQRIARGEILFISDANVRVSADDVRQTLAAFKDPTIGCVSNAFLGEGPVSFGSLVESLYLLMYVVPGCILADFAGVTCLVGKSIAIRRDVLEAIGGFESYSNFLAEDQAMGLAIREAGYRLALAPVIVRNVTVKRTLREVLARQIRWCKIRYAFSKLSYLAEFLGNPLPIALLACMSAFILEADWRFSIDVAVVIALRLLQAVTMSRATAAGISSRALLLVPLQDVLQFVSQFAPFFSREVRWRSRRARLGRGTLMLPSKREKPAKVPAPLERKPA
jgi:ceramide glucosyltransferase